jgi:elongation factor Ts
MGLEINPQMVKELRERTGVGMSKCKEALIESDGDMEKAIDYLRKAGMASSVKKEGRVTKDGAIRTAENAKDIAIVRLNSETDFVAKNERFQKFLEQIAEQAVQAKPESIEAFLQLPFDHDPSITIDEARNLLIQNVGENIQLTGLEIIPKTNNCSYGIYSHMGGKIVTIVKIFGASDEGTIAREIAMHVAAASPDYLHQDEIGEEERKREEEIARSQLKGKPENIIEKILPGKMQAFYSQVCLLSQPYIKETTKTVEQFLADYSKSVKKPLKIERFWRWTIA